LISHAIAQARLKARGKIAFVSYDLAVWEGDRPGSDAAAGEEFGQLYDRYIGSGDLLPPTPRIVAYVRALLDRYPDIDDDAGEDSPWADGPLMGDESGSLLYFPLVYSKCDEASMWAAQLARDHGLVCYDPQIGNLRP
jgi:hypothetical protein